MLEAVDSKSLQQQQDREKQSVHDDLQKSKMHGSD